ncbi:hypothetical protein FACS189472_13360 [Alphaproteobacteria bacterium]|nr:hypothetical protein FACS189472_13360 [Alphaproteobacteria bacterium]
MTKTAMCICLLSIVCYLPSLNAMDSKDKENVSRTADPAKEPIQIAREKVDVLRSLFGPEKGPKDLDNLLHRDNLQRLLDAARDVLTAMDAYAEDNGCDFSESCLEACTTYLASAVITLRAQIEGRSTLTAEEQLKLDQVLHWSSRKGNIEPWKRATCSNLRVSLILARRFFDEELECAEYLKKRSLKHATL